jgi:redox-sensitive bicupin YhaK (pirin superfamily)
MRAHISHRVLRGKRPSGPGLLVSRAVASIIDGRARDLGGFAVRRVLPSRARRMVGPFTFLDEMGPAAFGPGQGIDVPPHPHIGLSTVTYLFQGEIVHRDSLGSYQAIRPGDINWMTAGRGIVHSERTAEALRARGSQLHGLQLWVALPSAHEQSAPEFLHYAAATLPEETRGGVLLRTLAGAAYGMTSPVHTLSPLFYVDALMPGGSELPLPEGHAERAVYVVSGALRCGTQNAAPGRMLVFERGGSPMLRAERPSRVVLIGGAPLDGERHIYWNFVSSSKDRLEQAKRDWKEGRFPGVPGDENDRVALPE